MSVPGARRSASAAERFVKGSTGGPDAAARAQVRLPHRRDRLRRRRPRARRGAPQGRRRLHVHRRACWPGPPSARRAGGLRAPARSARSTPSGSRARGRLRRGGDRAGLVGLPRRASSVPCSRCCAAGRRGRMGRMRSWRAQFPVLGSPHFAGRHRGRLGRIRRGGPSFPCWARRFSRPGTEGGWAGWRTSAGPVSVLGSPHFAGRHRGRMGRMAQTVRGANCFGLASDSEPKPKQFASRAPQGPRDR